MIVSHLCDMYAAAEVKPDSTVVVLVLTDRGWWPCRGVLGSGDVTHFRYDVAEVKLSIREPPEWLTSLTESGQSTAHLHVLRRALRAPHCCDDSPYSAATAAATQLQQ